MNVIYLVAFSRIEDISMFATETVCSSEMPLLFHHGLHACESATFQTFCTDFIRDTNSMHNREFTRESTGG